MKTFMNEEFLLKTETAKELYRVAAKQPIFDYHALMSAKDIAENHQYRDLTEAWIEKSPEIWRLMRTYGIEEDYITGNKSPLEKFQKFAGMLKVAIGNPWYHWTYLMLKRFFDIEDTLNEDTADLIWRHASELLQKPEYSIQGLLKKAHVTELCLQEDLGADLKYYEQIRQQKDFPVKVLPMPSFDKVFDIGNPDWSNYMRYAIGASVGIDITTMQDLREAIKLKLNEFDAQGACTAVHNLPYVFYNPAEEYQLDDIVGRLISGGKGRASREEKEKFQTALLCYLGKRYTKMGWTMQLHYGVLRDNNSVMHYNLGSDAGCDCVGTHNDATGLVAFFDRLAKNDYLPRTVIYSPNPADAAIFATALGSFEGNGEMGHLQMGLGGQFNHTRLNVEATLFNIASHSLLDTHIGMVSDARTPLIYVQHEYYRRILCNYLGRLVEIGEYPADMDTLSEIVRNICYNRSAQFFSGKK